MEQPLLARAYIGQGLRANLEQFENDGMVALVKLLKRRGVDDVVIQETLQ